MEEKQASHKHRCLDPSRLAGQIESQPRRVQHESCLCSHGSHRVRVSSPRETKIRWRWRLIAGLLWCSSSVSLLGVGERRHETPRRRSAQWCCSIKCPLGLKCRQLRMLKLHQRCIGLVLSQSCCPKDGIGKMWWELVLLGKGRRMLDFGNKHSALSTRQCICDVWLLTTIIIQSTTITTLT